jgi:hypothetical protein
LADPNWDAKFATRPVQLAAGFGALAAPCAADAKTPVQAAAEQQTVAIFTSLARYFSIRNVILELLSLVVSTGGPRRNWRLRGAIVMNDRAPGGRRRCYGSR